MTAASQQRLTLSPSLFSVPLLLLKTKKAPVRLCAVCAVCAAGPGRAERGQERGHCSETGLAPHTPTSHTYRRHNSAEDRGITEIKIVPFSRKLHLASCQMFSMSVSNPGGRDCLVKHWGCHQLGCWGQWEWQCVAMMAILAPSTVPVASVRTLTGPGLAPGVTTPILRSLHARLSLAPGSCLVTRITPEPESQWRVNTLRTRQI